METRKLEFLSRQGAVLVGCVLVLVTGIAAPWFVGKRYYGSPTQRGWLNAQLPRELPSWQIRDEPLGATPLVQRDVADILRYDDFIFRRYRRGALEFAVFAAYWTPGKMPTRLVAEHTPDRCWVETGWESLGHKVSTAISVGSRTIFPAELRRFRTPVTREEIEAVFWLQVGDRIHDFRTSDGWLGRAWGWWRSAAAEGFAKPEAQLFVRISANVPLAVLRGERDFESVMDCLAGVQLGSGQLVAESEASLR